MPRHPLAKRLILALSLVGLGLSVVMLSIHRQLASGDSTYESFCNVNDQINCDAVLGSPYASFLGVPVAAWALLTYAAILALSVLGGRPVTTLLAMLSGVAAGYSLVMGFVSFALLGQLCLMCAGLYVVNLAILILAWTHSKAELGQRQAMLAIGVPLLLAVAGGGGAVGLESAGSSRGAPLLTPAEIAAREPEFYRWYMGRPVVDSSLVPEGTVHARGREDAVVTIVEFSDFQCGHCARAHHAIRAVMERDADVRLVFRHFPLDTSCNPGVPRQIHPTACAAAIAAECAGAQGKFWEYHDYLFDHQDTSDFVGAARRLGLDAEQFRDCVGRDAAEAVVARDVTRGVDLGIESTPTTYLNGRTIKGALEPLFYQHAVVIERAHARRHAGIAH